MRELDIPGVLLDDLRPHQDARGRFVEMFRAKSFPEYFVQANHSRSIARVLRGLHYHRKQADLWYVISGRIQVAMADLRERGQTPATLTVEMNDQHPTSLYIPRGVAHGFLALTPVDLIYWVTNEYDASDEYGIAWDDPTLGIPWKIDDPIVSERDTGNPKLEWDTIQPF